MDTRTLCRQHPWSCFSLPNAPSLQSLCEQRKSTGLLLLLLLVVVAASFLRPASVPKRRGLQPLPKLKTSGEEKWGQQWQQWGMRGEACLQTGKYLSSVHSALWLTFTGCLGSGSYSRFFTLETKAEDSCIRKLCEPGTSFPLPHCHHPLRVLHFHDNWHFHPLIYWLCAMCNATADTGPICGQCNPSLFFLYKGYNAFIINIYASRRYKTILKQAAGFQWIGCSSVLDLETLLTKSSHS